MKNSLFRRFSCFVAALLLVGSAAAEGLRLSEWQDNPPLDDFAFSSLQSQSLSQWAVTGQHGVVGEWGAFQHY